MISEKYKGLNHICLIYMEILMCLFQIYFLSFTHSSEKFENWCWYVSFFFEMLQSIQTSISPVYTPSVVLNIPFTQIYLFNPFSEHPNWFSSYMLTYLSVQILLFLAVAGSKIVCFNDELHSGQYSK